MASEEKQNQGVPGTAVPGSNADFSKPSSPDSLDLNRTISVDHVQEIDLGQIGPYQLVDFIGRGGAGIVYRARDPGGAEIAIKVMVATPFVTRMEISRFLSEANTSKLLRKHPNIITVYDTGQEGQNYYIAMELVPKGRTLNDLIGKKLSVEEVLNYVIPVAQALSYAHSEGILHRDLKPANILINEFDQPLLADFGLAKSENAEKMTMTGTILGTPRYMSPEQCGFGDGETTRQSDIYSFGLIIYELLTGVSPYPIFPEMGLPEMFKVISTHGVKAPRRLRKDISRNLEAVILRMLEKEKRLRYKEIAQVCADLEACRAGKAVSVRRLTWAERFEKWVRLHTVQALTIAIAILVGGALYYGLVLPSTRARTYAKGLSDVDAVAGKRKSILLEKELEAFKNPEAHPDAEDTEGMRLLLKARESLAARSLDDSEVQFKLAMEWAEKNNHNGILLESEDSLARIALAKGENDRAFELFQKLAVNYGKGTLDGKLAVFEAGAAQWLKGSRDEAKGTWREIIDISNSEKRKNLDNGSSVRYIVTMAELMLGHKDMKQIEETVSSFPQIFRGLGYWILAQNCDEENKKKEYLAEAAAKNGIFVWINNMEEK